MASKKFGKGSREWQMFVEFWTICQAYWIVESENEEYLDSVTDAISKFVGDYKDVPLAKHLGVAFAENINEESKR